MPAPAQKALFAASALLPSGWSTGVRITLDGGGHIAGIETGVGAKADDEVMRGALVAGMPNLHSHAFQRAMAGLTQHVSRGGDSFWSWREAMYRFLDALTPDDVEAIAAFLFVEMLEAGYTSVAEFHYLHHDATGMPYADPAEMAQRIVAAAQRSGIGLTLLPVYYRQGGFADQPAQPAQRRFIHDPDSFCRLIEILHARMPAGMRLGLAPHSLRAASLADLQVLHAFMQEIEPDAPWHIHAAEQQKEVDDCLAATGRRPIEWLLDEMPLDARWCVIHATHIDERECVRLAASGAVAGLCPSTEADLGDGLFDVESFLHADGSFGIGGDSHACVDPFAELRLLEYGQRLTRQQRNLSGVPVGASVGATLFQRALAGGRQALAQPVGQIALGQRADWVVLDSDAPAVAGLQEDELLDAAIFGPVRRPVRDVMVGGIWQVRDGTHWMRSVVAPRYAQVLKRVLARA